MRVEIVRRVEMGNPVGLSVGFGAMAETGVEGDGRFLPPEADIPRCRAGF